MTGLLAPWKPTTYDEWLAAIMDITNLSTRRYQGKKMSELIDIALAQGKSLEQIVEELPVPLQSLKEYQWYDRDYKR